MKTYHQFWDNFDTSLYKKIVEQRKQKQDLINHQKLFVI